MNTQSLEFKTEVSDKGKGKYQICHWDAWGTSGDVQHRNLGTNIIMAYHGFHERALQNYWVLGQSSHYIHHYDATGGDEYSDIVVHASTTLEYDSPDLMVIGSNYQKMYENVVATIVGKSEQTFSVYPTREMATLESLYDLRDRSQVMTFVACNLFLIPLLQQIPEKIEEYFGERSHLFLEVITDQEEENDKELVVFIRISLSPSEAFVKLKTFDRDWWLDVLAYTRGKLLVHVEFE